LLTASIKTPDPLLIPQEEKRRQDVIDTYPKTIDTNNPEQAIQEFYPEEEQSDRAPDIKRAFDRLRTPEIDNNGNHYLDLDNLSLTSKDLVLLNTAIASLPPVKNGYHINIQSNAVDSLPSSLFTNTNISSINAADNALETLPDLSTIDPEKLSHFH